VNYDALRDVLNEAYEQATEGKGKERHAAGRDFTEQPILAIPRLLQDDEGIAHIYQAIKKLQESMRLPPAMRRKERLGAINYIAASIMLSGCDTETREAEFFDDPKKVPAEVPMVTRRSSDAPRGQEALEAGRKGELPTDEGERGRVAEVMPLGVWLSLGGDLQEWQVLRSAAEERQRLREAGLEADGLPAPKDADELPDKEVQVTT
jgi:hypothetical protein